MAVFSQLAQDIVCVDALYVQPQVASIYLVRGAQEVAIIETGTSHSVDNLLATLAQLNIDKSQVKYVIPTHVHLDHAGGAGEMMKQFSQASLIVHPRGARHMINPEKLIAGSIEVYGEEKFRQLYGDISPIDETRILIADDLDIFPLGARELLFIDTPGHARHHFCIYDQQSEGIFSGDTFGISYAAMKQLARGLLPTTPPVQFDPEALPRSIDRLMQYKPKRLYLTHYGEYPDPSRQLASFKRWIDDYVRLCRQFNPLEPGSEAPLQQALAELIMQELKDCSEPGQLARVLKTDIRLNAQGLAHWWRSTHA